MSKRRPNRAERRKSKNDKKPPKEEKPIKNKIPKKKAKIENFKELLWKNIVAVILFLLSALGGVSAAYSFYPFVSIEPNTATSTSSFVDTKFVISNTSPLPINNVQYRVVCWDGDYTESGILDVREDHDLDSIATLDPHSSVSARIEFKPLVGVFIKGYPNDIPNIKRPFYQIWVTFDCMGIHFNRGGLFWAYKGNNGIYIWNFAGSPHEIAYKWVDGRRAVDESIEPLPKLSPPD